MIGKRNRGEDLGRRKGGSWKPHIIRQLLAGKTPKQISHMYQVSEAYVKLLKWQEGLTGKRKKEDDVVRYALDDAFIKARVLQIIKEQKIEVVIETGLAEGWSTLEFCKMVPFVIGIDIRPESVRTTETRLKGAGLSNYRLITGSSDSILSGLREEFPSHMHENTLYFLDAHCNGPIYCDGYWPLPAEIHAIPKGKGILVFHDFKTPGKDFGYDRYDFNGQVVDFDYDVVKPMLDAWSPTHRVEYMNHIDRNSSYRGVGFIFPS